MGILLLIAACASSPPDPETEGAQLLETVCTECHDLGGLDAFKGYWDRAQWRDMVVTMVDHGAVLDERQIEVVADYLALHYGRR